MVVNFVHTSEANEKDLAAIQEKVIYRHFA